MINHPPGGFSHTEGFCSAVMEEFDHDSDVIEYRRNPAKFIREEAERCRLSAEREAAEAATEEARRRRDRERWNRNYEARKEAA